MNESKTDKELILVAMLEPIDLGMQFTMWPLHITLLPWFNAPNIEEVQTELGHVLMAYQPFDVEVGEKAFFGQRKLPVRLIKNIPKLQNLHEDLYAMVQKNGWEVPGRYIGELFKPHVTDKAGREAEGTISIQTIYVFEKLSQGYRKAVAKVSLG